MQILLIEKYRSEVTSRLGDGRMLIACAEDADEATSLLSRETYDLILLNMSDDPPAGFATVLRLRQGGYHTPLLALTGEHSGDRATALDLGADEAIAEPVDPADLCAGIAALVQRSLGADRTMLRLGVLNLCTLTRAVHFRDVPVRLTVKEAAVLELMLLRKGQVLTKSAFLKHLYDTTDEPEINIIDVFVCKLRKKLERAGCVDPISTIWGRGYMLHEPAMRRQIPQRHTYSETTGA